MAQSGVDNTFRKKFNREEYLERARDREEKQAARAKAKSTVEAQRFPSGPRISLGENSGYESIVQIRQQARYYCSICECVVKDSANYLDHIIGKKHQRALGMSMRVERATMEQIQHYFHGLKKRKDTGGGFTEQDFDERVLKQQKEEEERKRLHRGKKKQKKKTKGEAEIDPDIATMMGFGGFGSSNK